MAANKNRLKLYVGLEKVQ